MGKKRGRSREEGTQQKSKPEAVSSPKPFIWGRKSLILYKEEAGKKVNSKRGNLGCPQPKILYMGGGSLTLCGEEAGKRVHSKRGSPRLLPAQNPLNEGGKSDSP